MKERLRGKLHPRQEGGTPDHHGRPHVATSSTDPGDHSRALATFIPDAEQSCPDTNRNKVARFKAERCRISGALKVVCR